MTKLDKALIDGTIFASSVLWMIYIVKNLAIAIFVALLITILIHSITTHLVNRKANKNKIGIPEMENLLALYGLEYQTDLLMRAIPSYFEPEKIDNGVSFNLNCEKVAAFINFKYSSCSAEDIAKFYRSCKKQSIKKAYIVSRSNPRNIFVMASGLDVHFIFITSKQLHRHLYKQNLLMESITAKNKRQKRKFREILGEIFQKKRAKYFFFCALTLGLFCIISPYKIYYLVMTSIIAAFGIICIFQRA